MKQSLSLKVSQNLSLTPQLQQSIRILQLSAIELNSEIQEFLETNPLIEESDSSGKLAQEENNKSQDEGQQNSEEWQQAFETRTTSNKTAHDSGFDFDATTASKETLRENLAWQIQMTSLSDKDKIIANSIIYSLNSDGYLLTPTEDLLALMPREMEIELDEVQAVLKLIQTLDPIGIAAKDLRERLLIIIGQDDSETSRSKLAHTIVKNHLDVLGSRNLAKLKKLTGAAQEDLESAIHYITDINPRISTPYDDDKNNYVVPDVIVKMVNNRWQVELNSQIQKKLKINDVYASMPKSSLNGEASKYISENLQEAKWFIKSLHNRYDTLKRVATAIVEKQSAFLEHGEQSLKPMVLQNIATELELHESTISRATSKKYMLTPLGVYELKYFFSSSLSTEDGSSVSSTAIRSIIKKLIEDEPKQKPISDNKIAITLDGQGFKVARRTVAKYREGMNIPSSSQRKSLL